MQRIIMHIDVNNAFLSWSAILLLKQGYKIDIRKIDAIIAGDEETRHGIVLAKSPSAKKKGVITAETIYQAKRKCPHLQVFPPNYEWYQKMSKQLFCLLSKYTPDIEVCSIDECFMDYSGIKHLYKDEVAFAHQLKQEIYEILGFTVNIGIANNKLCAKMASDFSKPNQVHTLYQNEIEDKMWPLPIQNLFGIGKKTTEKLKQLKINTIYDLAHADSTFLASYFKNQTMKMINHAKGLDDSKVISIETQRKGISNSTTLEHNTTNYEEIFAILYSLTENVALTLRKQNKFASVIAIQMKDKYFKSYSHQTKLKNATNQTEEIYKVVKQLFLESWNEEPIRLLGVRLDQLTKRSLHQVSLFEDLDQREQNGELEKVVDELKEKYGTKIIKNASLFEKQIHKKY